jgi:hypothetical protein
MTGPCFFQGDNEATIARMPQQKMHQFVDFIVRQKMTRSKAGCTPLRRARAARLSGQNPGLVLDLVLSLGLGLGLSSNSGHDQANEDTPRTGVE